MNQKQNRLNMFFFQISGSETLVVTDCLAELIHVSYFLASDVFCIFQKNALCKFVAFADVISTRAVVVNDDSHRTAIIRIDRASHHKRVLSKKKKTMK
jgi:hypothetical protein